MLQYQYLTLYIYIADLPAGAELVEGTLGHPREDVDHRVQPVLLVPLSERNHL
jgi:hypothetical protein